MLDQVPTTWNVCATKVKTILNKLLTHAVTACNKLIFVSILCWCKMLLVSFKNFLEIFNNGAQLFWECAIVLDIDYYIVLFLAP